MALRELILDTFAVTPDIPALADAWRRLRLSPRVFTRLIAVEECASDLLLRLRALRLTDQLPNPLLEELTARARSETGRMLAVRAQLEMLISAFQGANVPVTLLKGAAFLATGMRRHRSCSDIDLLVAPEHVDSAVVVLNNVGYRSTGSAKLSNSQHLPPFARQDAPLVELHTRALYRIRGEGEAGWQSEEVEGGISVLAPTDWCWHALAHEAVHRETAGRARGALDVAALIEHYGARIDWSRVAEHAAEWPDSVDATVLSLCRLGHDVPLAVSRRTRLSSTCTARAREYAARVAATDEQFAFAMLKIGGLTFGSPRTWIAYRRAGGVSSAGMLPSLARDAARLARILVGRGAG